MKICPVCRVTYDDESYSFCLTDGSLLNPADDPQRTLVMPGDYSAETELTEVRTRVREYFNPLEKTRAADLSLILAGIEQKLLESKFEKDELRTALQIARALIQRGLEAIHRGADPALLSDNLQKAGQTAAALIDEAKQTDSVNRAAQLVFNSCHDRKAADLIAEALGKVEVSRTGADAAIIVALGERPETVLHFVKGQMIDRGFLPANLFAGDDSPTLTLNFPNILLTEKKISQSSELLPLSERLSRSVNPELLVIAEDLEGTALNTLSHLMLGQNPSVVVVKAPGFGDHRRAVLQDMAVITGGKVFGRDDRRPLSNAAGNDLGHSRQAVISRDSALIIEANGNALAIASRIEEIKRQIAVAGDDDREKLIGRLNRLTGGVAVIRVGDRSEEERLFKFKLIKKALDDCLSGLAFGFVPGNDLALLNVASIFRKQSLPADEETNLILAEALETPFIEMVAASGRPADEILRAVRLRQQETNNLNLGYVPERNEITDLLNQGVIVPKTLVQRVCGAACFLAARQLANFRRNDEMIG